MARDDYDANRARELCRDGSRAERKVWELLRGHRIGGQRYQSIAAEPPDKVHVLHQRQRPHAADLPQQVAMDQQTLIAIRKRQDPASPGNEPFQPPRSRIETVKDEPKIASISGIIVNGRFPPRSKSSVGVEHQ